MNKSEVDEQMIPISESLLREFLWLKQFVGQLDLRDFRFQSPEQWDAAVRSANLSGNCPSWLAESDDE